MAYLFALLSFLLYLYRNCNDKGVVMQHIDIGHSLTILMAKNRVRMATVAAGTGLSTATLKNMKGSPNVGSVRNLIKVASFFKMGVIEFLTEGVHGPELEFNDD